jgi:hypothetical protein
MTDDEYTAFTRNCFDELQSRQQGIAEILAFDHSDVDLDRGVIGFRSDGRLFVECKVAPVGSWGPESHTWMWAWANPSMPRKLQPAQKRIKALQALTGRAELGAANAIPATEKQAWEFTAMARRQLDGVGAYRLSAEGSDWFFVISALTHHVPEADLVVQAARAVEQSLRRARGAGLLNALRKRFPALRVNLIDADLRGAPEPWAHDLHTQVLIDVGGWSSHKGQNLSGADLSLASLDGAILRGVTLQGASLENASLVEADLSGADLRGASFRSAFLNGANFTRALLEGADFSGAELSRTLLTDVDISKVKGLDDVRHLAPSEISFSTLIASGFEIDPAFLHRAGVSRGLIEDLMKGKRFASSYQTCFLSYSSKDAEFAGQLYRTLTEAGARVFWDHFDVIPGEELEAQIAEAIREHKRLLVVLSPSSMASEWVRREIETAWYHNRESLLPIRLCPIDDVKLWTASTQGLPDLANIFPIQDFSAWRDPQQYAHASSLLLTALAGGVDLRPDGGDG